MPVQTPEFERIRNLANRNKNKLANINEDGSRISTTFLTSSYISSSNYVGSTVSTSYLTASLGIKTNNVNISLGGGIDFSANASAAGVTSELFDDYEEGTWTPAFSGSTTPSGVTIGYNSANTGGHYTKIGRLVNLVGSIDVDSFTGGTPSGVLRITGLPFASNSSLAGDIIFSGLVNYYINLGGFITGSSYETYQVYLSEGSSILSIFKPYNTLLNSSLMNSSTSIRFNITYIAT